MSGIVETSNLCTWPSARAINFVRVQTQKQLSEAVMPPLHSRSNTGRRVGFPGVSTTALGFLPTSRTQGDCERPLDTMQDLLQEVLIVTVAGGLAGRRVLLLKFPTTRFFLEGAPAQAGEGKPASQGSPSATSHSHSHQWPREMTSRWLPSRKAALFTSAPSWLVF